VTVAPPDGAEPPGIPEESADELYHRAPCGYLSTRPDGTIVRANRTFLDWTGHRSEDLVDRRRFSELLGRGGRIYHETHLAPLLLMQGEVREIALELTRADGTTFPVLVNARLERDPDGEPTVIRITIFDATTRAGYERELLLARKRAEDSERRVQEVADVLQRSLLAGGLTEGPGFKVETRYRPAVQSLEVGGDWYDSFLLPDGFTLGVSVGDVVGRGITAAGAMGQVRSAIRALAGSGIGPGRLLDQLDDFVARVADARMATVAYAELDLRDGRLRYACAGHPPPLLVQGVGRAEFLWGGRSTPIASFDLDDPRPEAEVTLSRDSRLLLYTDGLVERRDRAIDAGLDVLAEMAADLFEVPTPDMVDELMARLLADEQHRDDVCLLCLCLEPEHLDAEATEPEPGGPLPT
jgi:sigma-B regulation protein RsbU (phosphoserine phosphatase)